VAVEDLVDDVFEVGEEAIDRVSRRRSIEATAEQTTVFWSSSRDWTDAVDVLSSSAGTLGRVLVGDDLVFAPASRRTHRILRESRTQRCSNNASVSVAITLKNSSIEVSSCRMLALVDTVPTSCVFVCDAFYDTLSVPSKSNVSDAPRGVEAFCWDRPNRKPLFQTYPWG